MAQIAHFNRWKKNEMKNWRKKKQHNVVVAVKRRTVANRTNKSRLFCMGHINWADAAVCLTLRNISNMVQDRQWRTVKMRWWISIYTTRMINRWLMNSPLSLVVCHCTEMIRGTCRWFTSFCLMILERSFAPPFDLHFIAISPLDSYLLISRWWTFIYFNVCQSIFLCEKYLVFWFRVMANDTAHR